MLAWIAFGGPDDAAECGPRERNAYQRRRRGPCAWTGSGLSRRSPPGGEGGERTRSAVLQDHEVTADSHVPLSPSFARATRSVANSSHSALACRRCVFLIAKTVRVTYHSNPRASSTSEFLIANNATASGAPGLDPCFSPITTHQLLLTTHAKLPETTNRVETHVTRRKQTIATPSTRDDPRHDSVARASARRALRRFSYGCAFSAECATWGSRALLAFAAYRARSAASSSASMVIPSPGKAATPALTEIGGLFRSLETRRQTRRAAS
jgi:hypothetical protein